MYEFLSAMSVIARWLRAIFELLTPIVNFFINNSKLVIPCVALVTVFCFFYNIIVYPEQAINRFMCYLVDMILYFWPSTPDHYKMVALINDVMVAFPNLPWAIFKDFFESAAAFFGLWSIVKIWRFLPFS